MRRIKLNKGLDLPLSGAPLQVITETKNIQHVALLGTYFPGLKPQFEVTVGAEVRKGQVLLRAKHDPRLTLTAPASGKVVAINRGVKRSFISLVIEVNDEAPLTFPEYTPEAGAALSREVIVQHLLETGQWALLRTRPFGTIPNPDTQPQALFITAMDTNPLAPDVAVSLQGKEEAFILGTTILARLTPGPVFLCKAPGSPIPVSTAPNLTVVEFEGPHPAGNPGTHIHFLMPVSRHRTVWYIDAQSVAAIGNLFKTGRVDTERVIALGGPGVKMPRLIRTLLGAAVSEIVQGELDEGQLRVIAGSVLNGHTTTGPEDFLGPFHQQISVLPEGNRREFLGWLRPGYDVFATKRVVLARLLGKRRFRFTTALNGSERAIVPVGVYEQVMPLDLLPTYLLRALAVADIEEAEKLGCLELEEEDLALCTFVCPSKIDHGANLRRVLNLIVKEEL